MPWPRGLKVFAGWSRRQRALDIRHRHLRGGHAAAAVVAAAGAAGGRRCCAGRDIRGVGGSCGGLARVASLEGGAGDAAFGAQRAAGVFADCACGGGAVAPSSACIPAERERVPAERSARLAP